MAAYQPCHEAFLRYCHALSYGRMDTEDLVQDVLLSAYLHFDSIRKKQDLLHYLIRAAKNRSASWWRKRKFRTELIDLHNDQLRDKGVSAEVMVDIQILYKALDELPVKQRDALILFEINGFSMKEIAALQDRSVGAIKTTISRGRTKLGELLSDHPSSPDRPVHHFFQLAKSIAL